MRSTLNFNSHWQFTKPGAAPVAVTLPHTWNAADGTDGGNDYFRGTCTYTKEFAAPAHASVFRKTVKVGTPVTIVQ